MITVFRVFDWLRDNLVEPLLYSVYDHTNLSLKSVFVVVQIGIQLTLLIMKICIVSRCIALNMPFYIIFDIVLAIMVIGAVYKNYNIDNYTIKQLIILKILWNMSTVCLFVFIINLGTYLLLPPASMINIIKPFLDFLLIASAYIFLLFRKRKRNKKSIKKRISEIAQNVISVPTLQNI